MRSCYTILIIIILSLHISPAAIKADQQLSGDFTGDCAVDIADLQVLSSQWLTNEGLDEDGLVAYWKFDETSGETLLESVSGIETELFGEPEWKPESGIIGGALYFDGLDDYSEFNNNLEINGTSPRTCTAWLQCNEETHCLFLTWGNSSQVGTLWSIGAIGDNPADPESSWQLALTANSDPVYSKNHPGINDGLWHHIAVVLEEAASPTSDNVRLYIDGVEAGAAFNSSSSINTSSQETIVIGQCPDRGAGWSSQFKGLLDEVRIYNRALSSQEISNVYNYGNSNPFSINRNTDPIIDNTEFSYLSETWSQKVSQVIISEFLADNDSDTPPDTSKGEILDGLGDSSDWIELHNISNQTVDISGWALTDNENKKSKWEFPENTLIEPYGYLLVFASKKEEDDYPNNYPYVDTEGYLHTNFSLSKDGEYLGLYNSIGELIHDYKVIYDDGDDFWGYPEQEENISFGLFNNINSYFATPTPSAENKPGYLSELDKPKFSHKRGYYYEPFQLELTSDVEGAEIRYTTDGTDPTPYYGEIYTEPITIEKTTAYEGICVRAMVSKVGHKSSSIVTHTFILNPTADVLGLPAISLVGNSGEVFYYPNGTMAINGGFWNSSGIWQASTASDYNYMIMHGMEYERPVSFEWLDNKFDESFHEDCGLRVHGSAWMRPRYKTPPISGKWYGDRKISQRLYFRNQYGSKDLNEQILAKFPEADKFDALVVRAGHNDISNPFVRDEMLRRLQYNLGHPASRGTFANLFINGDHKGYFNPCERLNEDFCQEAFDSDLPWDIVGWIQPDNVLEARDGDMVAFKEYIQFVTDNDLSNPVLYAQAIKQLDVESFIDYLIVQCWSGNWDWPQNNWTAASERGPNRKWHFFVWDGEGGMDNTLGQDRFNDGVGLNYGGHDLAKLYRGLRDNSDFRQLFCDRLQRHFFESDGWMQRDNLVEVFDELADEMSGIIDSIDRYIPNSFVPSREGVFINQCINNGLFTYKGPIFFLNGGETTIIYDDTTVTCTMENSSGNSGTIYYTLDGSDPRLPVTSREDLHTLVPENAPKKVLVPTSNIGTAWRGINYNDSSWTDGLPEIAGKYGAVGYEVNTTAGTSNTPYITYDIEDEMRYINTCAYIRIPFEITEDNLENWNFLRLLMRYDDGFVAYINGQRVVNVGVGTNPSWDSTATSHENNGMESFDISGYVGLLQEGSNILAIHGINTNDSSSDFIISPILEGGVYTDSELSPSAIQYTGAITFDRSEVIKARSYNGQWSSLREAKCLVGNVLNGLKISEIMYNPYSDPNEEYIEFTNASNTPIKLKNCSITDGIEFTFPDINLAPGEYIVVAADEQVFINKYGSSLPLIGEYTGRLDNSGENISVTHAIGIDIENVEYSDSWHDLTDGNGFSLTAVYPALDIQSDVTDNLITHYNFDEIGTLVHDSLNNHHGYLVGSTPKTRTSHKMKYGLRMDGFNDYITMPRELMLALDDFTFSCWIKLPYKYKSARILDCFNTNDQSISITANLDGYYNVTIENAAEINVLTSQAKTDIDEWTHLAVTKSGSVCTIYQNGYIIGQSDAFNISLSDLELFTQNWIGRSNDENVPNFDGWMDEVRFYDAGLEPEDVMVLSQGNIWNSKSSWRPSSIKDGTPGRAETEQEKVPAAGSIVINEILAHSHADLPDWIELKNTTDQIIDISGWYISDSDDTEAERKKYQIPANTLLFPSQPFYVIEESEFNNPANAQPFALSEGGETLYLQSAKNGELTGYLESESFGASESNMSFGRYEKSNGSWNFVAMDSQTKGYANSYPKVGPIVITEIMYNPADGNQDLEYIELTNISAGPQLLASYATTYLNAENTQFVDEWVPWKLTEGVEFEFPFGVVLLSGQSMLLVEDAAAFSAYYTDVPQGTIIYEWDNGALANEGEKIEISKPGDKEYGKDRYYIRTERVSYDDRLPWPFEADGTGKSLKHIRPVHTGNNYSNDPGNWEAGTPNPGEL